METKPAFKQVKTIIHYIKGHGKVFHCNSFAGHHNLDRHGCIKRNSELAATVKQKLGKLVITVSPLKAVEDWEFQMTGLD